MTYEAFISFRDVKVKNKNHQKVIKAFYPYLSSVTGNCRLLPDLIGRLLNINTASQTVEKGCFNGVLENIIPPYGDVDFYMQLSDGICIFIYGSIPVGCLKELNDNEYVIFMLSEDLNGCIERKVSRHVYIRRFICPSIDY